MDTLKLWKASAFPGRPVADFQIASDGEVPEASAADCAAGWERVFKEKFERQGFALGEFLVAHLPGGTISQLLCFLCEHKASLLRVPDVKEQRG